MLTVLLCSDKIKKQILCIEEAADVRQQGVPESAGDAADSSQSKTTADTNQMYRRLFLTFLVF